MTDKLLITEEWLGAVGFKWHQLDRQPEKQWLLWLGDAIPDSMTSFEDLGIELSAWTDGTWHCWLRADCSHKYSRFLHIRHLRTRDELIRMIEGLTGAKWNPENNLYGSMRTPERAANIRERDKRLDRYFVRTSHPWREIEKDDSCGGALPEHREELEHGKER